MGLKTTRYRTRTLVSKRPALKEPDAKRIKTDDLGHESGDEPGVGIVDAMPIETQLDSGDEEGHDPDGNPDDDPDGASDDTSSDAPPASEQRAVMKRPTMNAPKTPDPAMDQTVAPPPMSMFDEVLRTPFCM